jgi:formylglycine-generating enzyme required for sulfatase activity
VFSPDSKRLLDYGGNVWDAQTGQRLLNIEPRIIGTALAFSADGTRLAGVVVSAIAKEEPFVPTKYRHDLKVWDALNGKEIFTFRVIQKISSIAMSPDGKLIALFSPSDCRLTVRSSQDGQELFSVSASRNHSYSGMGLVASERHVAFSADGKLVAAPGYEGDSRGFKLWDARTGQEVAFKRLPYQVTFLAFTPDGERLISAGQDTFGLKKGFVTVWHRNSNRIDAPSHFTNSIGMKFAWIPAGQFLMGSPNEEKGRDKSEIQHKVTLTKGFYLGVHTVTQEQWQAVMANNPSQFKGQKNLPVERVSWNDCQEFIKKLRAIDNKPYRLPTEAEWEYACRARGTTPFYAGDSLTTDQANFDSFWEKTTPVGSFPPNAFGLFDMHGNVIQWCQDWHGEYSQDEVVDPQGPNTGTSRVWRGSLYFNNRDMCRSAYRGADVPQSREFPYGLRVCFFRD